MNKCKNELCINEVKSIEGRKPKLFCSDKCRVEFHNSKKIKGVGKGRPKGSKNKPKTIVVEQDSPVAKALVEISEKKKEKQDRFEKKVNSINTHPQFGQSKGIKIDLSDKDDFLNS